MHNDVDLCTVYVVEFVYAILLPIYDFFACVSKFSDAAGETNTGRIAAGCAAAAA